MCCIVLRVAHARTLNVSWGQLLLLLCEHDRFGTIRLQRGTERIVYWFAILKPLRLPAQGRLAVADSGRSLMLQRNAEAGGDVRAIPNLMPEDQHTMDIRALEVIDDGIYGSSGFTNPQYTVNSKLSIGGQVW